MPEQRNDRNKQIHVSMKSLSRIVHGMNIPNVRERDNMVIYVSNEPGLKQIG